MRFDGQSKRLVVGSALNVGDWDLGEVVDPERRRKISGVCQDDAERCPDRAHLHAEKSALAALKINRKTQMKTQTFKTI